MAATSRTFLALNDGQRVAIRVPNYQAGHKPKSSVPKTCWTRRDERNGSGTERLNDRVNVIRLEFRLPMHEVVRAFIGREGPAVVRAQVFKKLDTRPRRSAQRGNTQARAEHVVQVLLFGSVVFAFSCNAQSQKVAIEPETGIRVLYGDRRVVDAKKHTIGLRLPFRVAFPSRKVKDFKRVSVGIFEIKRFDAAGVLVPIGQTLRTGRSMFHVVLPQNRIGAVHVAHDDGEVLEPQVVAAGIGGNRTATRSEKLDKFDRFA